MNDAPGSTNDRLLLILIGMGVVNFLSPLLVCPAAFVLPGFWTAQFSLTLIWSVFGPGPLWQRFFKSLLACTFLVSCQLLISALLSYEVTSSYLEIYLFLLPMWIFAHVPLGLIRNIWKWKLAAAEDAPEPVLSILDLMTATGIAGIAFACISNSSVMHDWLKNVDVDQRPPFEVLVPVVYTLYLSVLSILTLWLYDSNQPYLMRAGKLSIAAMLLPLMAFL